MLPAYARDGPQPRRQKVGRCVDKALRLGALAALQDLPGRPDSAGGASLGCLAGLSKAERPGLELWTMKLLSRSIANSICRSWRRERCGKFFLNKRAALAKYRTTGGIQNRKWLRFFLFHRQLSREQETDAPLVACISYDEKPGAIGKTAPDLPPVPEHCPRLRVRTPWNG